MGGTAGAVKSAETQTVSLSVTSNRAKESQVRNSHSTLGNTRHFIDFSGLILGILNNMKLGIQEVFNYTMIMFSFNEFCNSEICT